MRISVITTANRGSTKLPAVPSTLELRWDWIESAAVKQENTKRKQKKRMTTTIAHDHWVFFIQVTPCRYKTPRLVAQWSGRLIHLAHTWCERQQVFFTEIDDILCLRRMSTLVLPTARAQAAESGVRCRQGNSGNSCHQLWRALQLRNLWLYH